MNAFEFVKEKGLKKAKVVLTTGLRVRSVYFDTVRCEFFDGTPIRPNIDVVRFEFISDLKRIVDSHEIVESHKFPEDDETGLDGAHCLLDMYGGYELVGEKLERLKQAISDVEQCQ